MNLLSNVLIACGFISYFGTFASDKGAQAVQPVNVVQPSVASNDASQKTTNVPLAANNAPAVAAVNTPVVAPVVTNPAAVGSVASAPMQQPTGALSKPSDATAANPLPAAPNAAIAPTQAVAASKPSDVSISPSPAPAPVAPTAAVVSVQADSVSKASDSSASPLSTPVVAVPLQSDTAPSPLATNQTQVAQVPANAAPQPQTPAPTDAPSQPTSVQPEDELVGIDTLDLDEPQGNWLYKRAWWQRAETQYEKIKALVDTIMESRMAFFAKRTEWDKTIFDPFYLEIGVGRGILEELISDAISQLDKEREKDGQLSPEERELFAAFQAEKANLEQLQKDIQKINAIDNAIDDAIGTLIGQINAARTFEKKSWQNLKKIAQELSDKSARDLYYGMANYWQNTNDIASYIQTPFLQYFEQLGSSAKDQIAIVIEGMKGLKEKGIDFKKQWQNLEAKNLRARDASEYHKGLDEAMESKKIQKEEPAKNDRGFFGTVAHKVTSTVGAIINSVNNGLMTVWNFTLGRFFSKKVSVEKEVKVPTHVMASENGNQ